MGRPSSTARWILCICTVTLVGGCGGRVAPTSTPLSPPPSVAFSFPAASTFNIQDIIDRILHDNHEMTPPQVDTANPALFVSNIDPQQPDVEAVKTYLTATIGHLDSTWTDWFLRSGFAEPNVFYDIVMPGESFKSTCYATATVSDYANAYYCPTDTDASHPDWRGEVVLPATTFSKMWTGDLFGRHVSDLQRTGDFAAAYIVAHEFGHNVQDELAVQTGKAPPTNPQSELIADCFAGVWTYAVFLSGYLEAGDVDEAYAAAYAIGDPNVTVQSHGTGAQRQNAYLIGYQGSQANPVPGLPANCITAYWPTFWN